LLHSKFCAVHLKQNILQCSLIGVKDTFLSRSRANILAQDSGQYFSTTTRQAIELDSCSNPQKIRLDLHFGLKKFGKFWI